MNIYVLDVTTQCSSPALSVVLPAIKNIMLIIQIVAPITLIIMATIELTKMVSNPDDKKGTKKLINKVIAAFIIFFIPLMLDVVMGIVGESTEFSNCWVHASDKANINKNNKTVPEDTNEKKSTKINDSKGWE